MFGLNGSLSIATQSLMAQDGALGVTNNNIANANTPGYSRQLVVLSAQSSVENGSPVDAGVSLGGFHSVRDAVLQMSLQQQTSAQASADSLSSSLSSLQTAFASTNSDLGTSFSKLFSSLSSLSTNPTDSATRQTVLSAASNLATAFHQTSASVSASRQQADTQVAEAVTQINHLSAQIAQLNGQLSTFAATGQDGGSTLDERDQLVLQLAKITGVAQISSNGNETLTTGNGRPLVVDQESHPLALTTGPDGMQHVVDASGHDITQELHSGSLGGALQLRDNIGLNLQNQLDTLAKDFGDAMNSAQASGFDQNGAAGENLFAVPGTSSGAASSIALSISDPALIAASSDGSSGSNGNVTHLLAVQRNPLPSGKSPVSAYADLVFQVGNSTSEAMARSAATQLSVQQLTNQRSSISGVSIDEESTNLIRFQQAYQAAAKVISTIDSLYSVVLNMGSGGGGF